MGFFLWEKCGFKTSEGENFGSFFRSVFFLDPNDAEGSATKFGCQTAVKTGPNPQNFRASKKYLQYGSRFEIPTMIQTCPSFSDFQYALDFISKWHDQPQLSKTSWVKTTWLARIWGVKGLYINL
jgi:hypothetical protein